jgi:hypothetical protein
MNNRERNSLPKLEEVQFLLGASVLTYEDGRVKIVSWGRYGGIRRVGYGGLRRLGEEDEQETTA